MSFWSYQLGASWRNLGTLKAAAKTRLYVAQTRGMLTRHRSACASPMTGVDVPDDEKLTVIVLNHKRPENVAMIARYALRSGFVGRLVISNNSQNYRIERYVRQADARLTLLNQERASGVGIRFELARQFPARYYVCIDDDIFLHPVQLQWVYSNLRQATERPHGIFGAELTVGEETDKQWPFAHRRNKTGPVHILNGLFAFTHEHMDEFFRLCKLLGIEDPSNLMNGEDIILSFSGDKRPLIHNVGSIWECASASAPGIALHKSRPRFYEERLRIFSELEKAKPL